MKILMVAAVLSIAIEVGTAKEAKRSTAWIEGFAVLVAVFVCASVTAVNDYQKVDKLFDFYFTSYFHSIFFIYRKNNSNN